MSITEKHIWGWEQENDLYPLLEEALGEKIVKTTRRYDTHDYISDSWLIELKCRTGKDKKGNKQDSTSFKEWLVPTCKIKETDKNIVFFYYWAGDNSLWWCVYDEELFDTFEKKCPFWHPSKQEHYYIPREHFTRL